MSVDIKGDNSNVFWFVCLFVSCFHLQSVALVLLYVTEHRAVKL